MEKNLNLRKLFLMYLRNLWIIILVGIIFAGVAFVAKKDGLGDKTVSETIAIAFEIPDGMDEGTYSKRTVYFDNYRGLLAGNAVTDSDAFTKEEKEIFKSLSSEELSGTFTVTVSVPDRMSDQAALELMEKYISESEKWMKNGINDPTFKLNVLKREVSDAAGGGAAKFAVIFFIIGGFLTAIVMFFVFVLETAIHDTDDLQYYTDISPVFETGKKNSFAADEIGRWLISTGKKTALLFADESGRGISGTAEKTAELLNKYGVKASVYNIGGTDGADPKKTADKLTEAKNNNDIVLVTAPTLRTSPAALHISPLCDLRLLCVDADRENGIKLKKKLESLSALGLTADGAVLDFAAKNKIFRL